jgi:hypothetical protein
VLVVDPFADAVVVAVFVDLDIVVLRVSFMPSLVFPGGFSVVTFWLSSLSVGGRDWIVEVLLIVSLLMPPFDPFSGEDVCDTSTDDVL